MKFVIGRYYFNSLFRDDANKTFLDDLMAEPVLPENNFDYALGDFNTELFEGFTLVRGTFGKIKKNNTAEVYDRVAKGFKKEDQNDIVTKKIEFLINHENHLIFVEYDTQLGPEYFADKFKKIYLKTSAVSDIEMDFIVEEKDIYETIKSWEKVERVSFKKLRPSNPSSLDDFKEIEELIKETGSDRTDIDFRLDPKEKSKKSINYGSKLIRQALALAFHGYGEARLEGEEHGKKVDASSVKFMKKIEVDFTEDGALKKITQTIEQTQKGEKHD